MRPLHHGSEAEGGRVELPRRRCARRFSRPRPAPAVGWSFPIRAARVERAASPVGAGRSVPAELRAVSGQGRARTCDLPDVNGALIPAELLGLDGRTWDRTRGLSHVTRALIPLSYASGNRGVRDRTRTLRLWRPDGLATGAPPRWWGDRRDSNPRRGDHNPECCALHHGHSGERRSRTSLPQAYETCRAPGSARRRTDTPGWIRTSVPPPSQGGAPPC